MNGRRRYIRPALVVLGLVGLWAIARLSGLHEEVDTARVRAWMDAAGAWGFVLFIAVFALGELAHIPGLVFVAAAVLAYGRPVGWAASIAGSLVAVTVSFLVVRRLGGQPFERSDRPWLGRMLARLDDHPIRTVVLLRLVLWMAPFLNYALAMTGIRTRDYVVGSVLGLLLPITVMVLFFDWLFA